MSEQNSTKLTREDLQKLLYKYIEDHDTSITKVSFSIPLGKSTLNLWINGKYTGDNENIDLLVEEFLKREDEIKVEDKLEIPFCNIRNAEIIYETIQICRRTREIAVIYGNAGLGKTKAITEYCKANKDVVLIESDPKYSAKILFREFCRVLGLPASGNIWDMFNSVLLTLKDTSRPIVIDEAENLSIDALNLVRRINDKAHVGIVLLGLPRLYYNMKGYRADYAYLYSRAGFVRQLQTLSLEDVTKIVERIFPKSNGISNVYYKACEGNGRKLEKLLKRSKDVMLYNSMKMISASVVEEVSKLLMK
jgi:DNA transposition AAA+ family ATPase